MPVFLIERTFAESFDPQDDVLRAIDDYNDDHELRWITSFLSADQALHLTHHGVNQNEDGSYTWKFDNYVRAFSPYTFNTSEAKELWGNIDCPTLLVRGEESWAGDPEKDGRASHFKQARSVNIPKAGHWVHHDQLERFLEEVTAFLDE